MKTALRRAVCHHLGTRTVTRRLAHVKAADSNAPQKTKGVAYVKFARFEAHLSTGKGWQLLGKDIRFCQEDDGTVHEEEVDRDRSQTM